MPPLVRRVNAFSLVLTLWSFGEVADAQPATLGACANNPCGSEEAAACQETYPGYICHCKAGYTLLHKYCVPQGPCGTYPCGMNGERCYWVGENTYRCKCKDGFTESSLEQPTCVPAEGDCGRNPCGFGGLCKATPDGKHTCQCIPGYEAAPSTKGETCRKKEKVSCDHQPCGSDSAARCMETPGGYFCVCREGTSPTVDNDGNATCQLEDKYDPCHSGACHVGSTVCTYGGVRRTCACAEGYDPKPVNEWGDERCYPRESVADMTTGKAPDTDTGNYGGIGGGAEHENIELPVPVDEKNDKSGNNTVIIAGGVLGALLLLGAIGGGLGYRHYKKTKAAGCAMREDSINFEGKDGSEAAGDEADVLIKARNEDWAH